MDAGQVIIKPIVSEKSYTLATVGKYTFRVHPDAHKTQIKQAIEELFGVGVADLVGAASLLVTEEALAELTRRAKGEKEATE